MRDSYGFYVDQLQGEYAETFKKIEYYYSTLGVDDDTQEAQMGEILDVFISAQKEGRPVADITGNNIERFCKMLEEGIDWKSRLLGWLDRSKVGAWLLLVFSILDLNTENIWGSRYQSNVGLSCAAGIVIFTGLISYIKRLMFRKGKASAKQLLIYQIGLLVVLFGILIAVGNLMEGESSPTPLIWPFAVGSVIFLVFYYLFNWKRLRARREFRIHFSDLVQAETDKTDDMDRMMQKMFDKKNARLVKKGKNPVSMEEFLEKQEKDLRLTEKMKWLYIATPVVISAFFAYTAGFESISDFVLGVGIMFAVEAVFMYGIWKIAMAGVQGKRAWIEKKRSELEQ